MKNLYCPSLLGLVVIALLLGAPTAQASNYTYTDLIVGSVQATYACGLNNTAQVVGGYSTSSGWNSWGFLYQSGSYTTTFNLINSNYWYFTDINSTSKMVGNDQATDKGFLMTSNSYSMIQVYTYNAPNILRIYLPTRVEGINDSGMISGYYYDSGDIIRGFTTINTGEIYIGDLQTIMYPNSTSTYVYGLNNAGDLVGYFNDDSGLHGFIKTSSGFSSPIDAPFLQDYGKQTYLVGINDQGVAVGYCYDGYGSHLNFIYDVSTGIFTPIAVPGLAQDINNLGQVVGSYGGYGAYNGFLASPVPLPGSLLLLGSGLLGLAALGRRRKRKSV